MSDFSKAQEFAKLFDIEGSHRHNPATLRQAVVAGIEMGSVSVFFADGEFPAGGVNFLDSYHPVVGDTVWVAKNGRDTLILGKIVIPGGLDQDPLHYVGDVDHGEPGFQNNWQNYGNDGTFTYEGASFYKDPDGWVHLAGLIKNTSGSAYNTTIFTLPAGYRPDYQARIPMAAGASGYSAKIWPVQVDPSTGNVNLATGSNNANVKDYISLDGFRFMAATDLAFERFHEWTPFGKMGAWVWDSDVQTDIFPGIWQRWDGLVRVRGRFKSGTTDQIAQISERACRRRWNVMFPSVAVNTGAFAGMRIDMTPHTRSLDRISSTDNDEVLVDGLQWWADIPESYWTDLTGANSWVRHSTTEWIGPRFFKDGYGVVHVKGLLKNGSTALDTVLTSALPPDCRPLGRRVFASWSNNGSTRIDVETDGTIRLVDTTAGNTFLTLDPISFRANEVFEF